MSVATDNNAATPGPAGSASALPARTRELAPNAVERALAAAIQDATRIADLLDALRSARLWLPLPDAGPPGGPVSGAGAVTLPTVIYLGCEFIPAYTSAGLLADLAGPEHGGRSGSDQAGPGGPLPHIVVPAADLARLLPPDVGIALNVGASESVPVYPQGVAYLAADEPTDTRRISVGPLPVRPELLLAEIRSGLTAIPQASQASAGWLSVQFAGEGMIVSVTLDDPRDAAVRDQVIAALERAARTAAADAGYPIDVTFPGEGEPDHIDHWIATATEPFYVRA
jgi:SseB protein N-terminal domain